MNTKAQDYQHFWDAVEHHLEMREYKTAQKIAETAREEAAQARLSTERLAATLYVAQCMAAYQNDATDSMAAMLEELLPELNETDQMVCHALLASTYGGFRASFETLEADRLKRQEEHRRLALANVALLKQTPADGYRTMLSPIGSHDDNVLVTPTLYDVAMFSDMQFCNARETHERLMQLADFHRDDANADLRIALDIRLLKARGAIANEPAPTLADWQALIAKYAGMSSRMYAQLYMQAALMAESGKDYATALAYCDTLQRQLAQYSDSDDYLALRQRIVQPQLSMGALNIEISGQHNMTNIATRNIDTLYCRVVDVSGLLDVSGMMINYYGYQMRDKDRLKDCPVVSQWSQTLGTAADHQMHKAYCYLPPLKPGHYALMLSASDDLGRYGYEAQLFDCGDAMILSYGTYRQALTGFAIDRVSGRPITGQKVELVECVRGERPEVLATATTDGDGWYDLGSNPTWKNRYHLYVRIAYHGYTLLSPTDGDADRTYAKPSDPEATLLTDRPIYKPGEEVRFSCIAYRSDRWREASPMANQKIAVVLKDVNGKAIDTARTTTDAHGLSHGTLTIPDDALPGSFHLNVMYLDKQIGHQYLRVEAYKQPTFTVRLQTDDETPRLGQPVRLSGDAVSYTQVPLAGAKVSYTIERSVARWWYWQKQQGSVAVASGETVADAQGHFEVFFVPEPDSTVELTPSTVFTYTLRATVSDLSGETHEQSHSLRIGYRTRDIAIVGDADQKELEAVRLRLTNIEGDPISGKVHLRVERLAPPDKPQLTHRNSRGDIAHSIDRDQFAQWFPGMAYSADDCDSDHWPTDRVVFEQDIDATADAAITSVTLPKLGDGHYRITATSADADGKEIEARKTIVATGDESRRCQSRALLWSRLSAETAQVGETVWLTIGSRFDDVYVVYAVDNSNHQGTHHSVRVSDGIVRLPITIDEGMLGGATVTLMAVREGKAEQAEHRIEVPFSHKRLAIKLESFRDKMLPGSSEQWTLRIADLEGRPQPASMTLTMYDAALDSYNSLHYSLWPWRGNRSQTLLRVGADVEFCSIYNQQRAPYLSFSLSTGYGWRIDARNALYKYLMYEVQEEQLMAAPKAMLYKRGAGIEEDDAANYDMIEAASAEMAEAENEAGTADAGETATPEPDDLQLRENLSTLAFFEPCLHSDDSGALTVSFTMPDALTQWRLLGLAFTDDLKTGTIEQYAVTRKELMVRPLAPRFFRQGDRVAFAAKVSNLSDEAQSVTVRLLLTDPSGAAADIAPEAQTIAIEAGGSGVARFAFEVPGGCHALRYRITAVGKSHSDGEADIVPVLSNRVLVTESQAMYVNHAGTKRYDLPALGGEGREPRLLAVEFTSNPLWLAIQSLPYVADHENPSTLYLANQYYCNSVARRIVDANPAIEQVFAQWENDASVRSRLNMNADIKQTDGHDTPYAQEAENEEQRLRRIKNYFDGKATAKAIAGTAAKLNDAQRDDGGWSWIAGGQYSSAYITRAILLRIGELADDEREPLDDAIERALDYIDAEAAKTYDYYAAHHIDDAQDLDYLYVRSFYADYDMDEAARRAYDYYLANAKRHCLKADGLASRAVAAIVMQRAGEPALARQLTHQLEESWLESDEMGIYWRDNVAGLLWDERPIEVQSLIIAAFREAAPDKAEAVAQMRQWLLKQKQTTSWQSDMASVAAIAALLSDGQPLADGQPATVAVGHDTIGAAAQAGTGYLSQRWKASQITPDMTQVVITQHEDHIGWGAAYWQYEDQIDRIASSSMGIALKRQYLLVGADQSLTPLADGDRVQVGDHVRVQVLISCDRNLEYLQLTENRPAGFEPVSSRSGWRWNDGLSYYGAVTDTDFKCYIDRLDKGRYVVSYDLYATQSGTFASGLSVMQSLYAPEFRALGPSTTLVVAD